MWRLVLAVLFLISCGQDPVPPPTQSIARPADLKLDEYAQKIEDFLKKELAESYNDSISVATEKQMREGHAIYQQRCAGCHGTTGMGDGMLAAHLNPKPSNFTDKYSALRFSDKGRMHIIKVGLMKHGAQMTPFGEFLDDDDIFAVYSYTKAFIKE